ncbi:hypothetical protein M378DRAFT_15588 [Amanita muscaria Koide BX008]|uniref:Uncharacterized protein n=1 Tax=Amanita muscaria (strain Koide BX008) TaxID=946122 RepID=A0A0C2WNY2_AMAMK|nr:hypothetical protein M378DRAFT_15588 [Amanita muscaria Koide BX008]
MEDGSDKENIPPRPITPTPTLLTSSKASSYWSMTVSDLPPTSMVLYEVISKESAVLMDLLKIFHNIAYTPPMGEEVSRYQINLLVDLALHLLQNGVELILYESLWKVDWNQDHCFEYIRKDQDHTLPAHSSLPPNTSAILQRCSELQVRLERETRALTAILPLAFNETPKLEWSEECYLDNAIQHLGHLASPSSLLPDAPITTTPKLTYPTFPRPPIPPITPEIQRKRDQCRRRRNQMAKKPTPPSPSPGPSCQVARRTQGRPERRYQG